MESVVFAQLFTVLLFLATPTMMRKGLPSTQPFTKVLSSLLRSLRIERPRRRVRRTAMRGARPWWE